MPMSDDAWRIRQAGMPIKGPLKALAREVRRLMGYEEGSPIPYVSTRAASRQTGLNNNTIAMLAQGHRATRYAIETFARGMGGDRETLLGLANYLPEADESADGGPGEDMGEAAKRVQQRLCERVIERQSELGLTGAEIAVGVGEDPQVISRWRTGATVIPSPLLPALARTLRCSVSYLLGEATEREEVENALVADFRVLPPMMRPVAARLLQSLREQTADQQETFTSQEAS